MGGMATYRTIGGRKWLIDDWHRAQADTLRQLAEQHGRPIATAELAAALGVPEGDVTHMALVKNGYALLRGPRGAKRALWPRMATEPRLVEAVAAFRRIPLGTTVSWKEPRRTSTKKFVTRRMTISKTLRSRVQTGLRAALRHIGVDRLRNLEQHHLRLILDATWTLAMMKSVVPRELWHAKGDVAARARHSADNRRSEIMQFLSWGEREGYLSLHDLESITLPAEWSDFVLRAEGAPDQLDVIARRLAKIAFTRLHIASPERLVDYGFAAFEGELVNSDDYGSEASARTTLSKLRRAWNYCAGITPPYPAWPSDNRTSSKRLLPDGGLELSWWSADGFFDGRATLLDAAGMELQKQEARDLKDWWTLQDPGARPIADGGPLPKRPKLSRKGKGRKRLGARRPEEETAKKPLTVVSRLQRFALTNDEPELRVVIDDMRGTRWAELFRDTERLKRYVRWEIKRNYEGNKGKCLTGGTRLVWYVQTLQWAYFAAPAEARLDAIMREHVRLDLTSVEGQQRAELLERETAQRTLEIRAWHTAADEVRELIENLIADHGGEIRPRKDKTAIRAGLDHKVLRALADHLRDLRLERHERLLRKTRTRARKEDEIAPSGIAWEVIDRTYCRLAMQEFVLRAHSLLPIRPGTIRRAQIGVHFDPDTLELAVIGRQDKVEKDARGNVKKQRVKLDEIAWWDDPEEVADFLRVFQVYYYEARVWLLDHPTESGLRLRRDDDDAWLLINTRGTPWRRQSTYSTSFKTALTSAARSYNKNAPADLPRIELPKGWGARGVYVPRFLYGQRIRNAGGTFEDIAAVLGNSPMTAMRYYQDEQAGEAQNRVTEKLRRVEDRDVDSSDAASTLEILRAARSTLDAEAAGLGLDTDEVAKLWQVERRIIIDRLTR